MEGHFGSLKTFKSYFNSFLGQLDSILVAVNSHIVELKGDYEIEPITPGADQTRAKLKILFRMIDELVELLERKKVTGIVLEEEKFFCFHWYLFHKVKIFLLKKRAFP